MSFYIFYILKINVMRRER